MDYYHPNIQDFNISIYKYQRTQIVGSTSITKTYSKYNTEFVSETKHFSFAKSAFNLHKK